MNILRPAFENPTPRGLRFQVMRASWHEYGGPSQADIETTGSYQNLLALVDRLGEGVELWDSSGYCWWGMLAGVTIHAGVDISFSIDQLYNRVAVAYSYVGPGVTGVGERRTTAWVEDANSIARFGHKAYLASGSRLSDTAAEQKRDNILEASRQPQGLPQMSSMSVAGIVTATLTCRGWWSTLGWQYADVPLVTAIEYATASTTEQAVGSSSSTKKVTQLFTVGASDVHVMGLEIKARMVGSPEESLQVSIHEVSGGVPVEDSLVSGSVAIESLTTALAWVRVDLSETVLSASTQYAVVITRSGSTDASNYFAVAVDTALGYSGGVFRIYNGSSWVARSPDADMLFRIKANEQVETTTQITDLVSDYCEKLTGTKIVDASGITQGSYQDGDSTVDTVIENLLEVGTTGGVRLLPTIDRNRKLIVSEEKAKPSVPIYRLDHAGRIYRAARLLTEIRPPVGEWVRVGDAVDVPEIGRPSRVGVQLVKAAEWTPQTGLTLITRGGLTAEEILGEIT
jgi:hypothetical protein